MNKSYLFIFILIFFTSNTFACDALKLTGTSVSKAQNTFFIIDGYSEEDFDEWATVQYVGYTADYCPKSNLENSSNARGMSVQTLDGVLEDSERKLTGYQYYYLAWFIASTTIIGITVYQISKSKK